MIAALVVLLEAAAPAGGKPVDVGRLELVLESVAKVREGMVGRESLGTAFLVGTGGGSLYFLTNAHVMGSSTVCELYGPGYLATATLRAIDAEVDLALLEVKRFDNAHLLTSERYRSPYDLTPFQQSREPTRGQGMFLLGFAEGDRSTEVAVTGGKVLRAGPKTWVSARASPGNSGGPAVDDELRLIGVLRAGLVGAPKNENEIIPLSAVRAFLERTRVRLSATSLERPPEARPPASFDPRCVIALLEGRRRVGVAYPLERAGDEVLLVSQGSRGEDTWEYESDAGVARAAPNGKAPPGWLCPDGLRPSIPSIDTEAWAVSFPRPWSRPSESTLRWVSHPPPGLLGLDSQGRVLRGIVAPNLRVAAFKPPGCTWKRTAACTATVTLENAGVAVRARIIEERLAGAPREREVEVPASGRVDFDVQVDGCEDPAALTLVRVRVVDDVIPPVSATFVLNDKSVAGGLAYFEPNEVSLAQVLRVEPSGGARPHYLCADRWVNGTTGESTPVLATLGQSPVRLPNGVVATPNLVVLGDGGSVNASVFSGCDPRPRISADEVLDFSSRGAVLLRGDAGTPVTGLPASTYLVHARALLGEYDVLVGTPKRLERYRITSSAAELVATYARPYASCLLAEGNLIWCEDGPEAPEGLAAPKLRELARCRPIAEACPPASPRTGPPPATPPAAPPTEAAAPKHGCGASGGSLALFLLLCWRRWPARFRRP